MKIFLVPLLIFTLMLLSSKSALALGISPYIVDLSSDAGQETNKTIKIFNDSSIVYSVKSYAHDIIFDKNGNKSHKLLNSNDSIAKYTEIIPASFTLKPNESKEVKIIVKTPKVWNGGKESLVLFDAKPEVKDLTSFSKKITARLELNISLGALILHDIKGTTTIKSRIVKADIQSKKSGKKLELKMSIENSGNTHIKTSGFASIISEQQAFIGKMELPQTIVFPGHNETIISDWEGEKLEPGVYHAMITYEYGEDKSVVIDKVFNVN